MSSLLRDVTIYGTAARAARTLKRTDLAGKTGTTNEHVDAWFCGYQQTVTGCAWIGFSQPKNLGNNETGGAAALPIWIGYMQQALQDVPESLPEAPEGLVTMEVLGASAGPAKELFYKENVPPPAPPPEPPKLIEP